MKKIIYSLIIFLIFSFILLETALAIGMITEPIVFKDVLRGQELSSLLTLFNSAEKEITYELKAEGEIADWTTFYQTEIQVPAKSHLNTIVKFNIPKDIPNGDYSGELMIIGMAGEEKDTGKIGSSVRLKVSREVSISITDKEIIDFDTAIIPLEYVFNKGEPLEIKIIYDNQGNVIIKPDVQLKISKDSQTIHNAIYPYPEDEEAVKPFERKTLSSLIKWSSQGQEVGHYQAEFRILLNGEIIQEDDFYFNIKSGFNILGAMAFLGGGNLILSWFVLGFILVILAIILGIFYKKAHLKP